MKQVKNPIVAGLAVWSIVVTSFVTPCLHAAEPETAGGTTVKMGEIVVTASKIGPHGEQIIGPAAVEAESMSSTAEGLLDCLSGIDLRRRAFSGNDSSSLSIRGFDESRSLIMLNDRPLHGAGVYGGYYVDWASLSLEDVESVEVIRGMTPAKYGNTLGGLVNITTAQGSDEPQTKIRVGGGSLGTWDGQARHSGPIGPVTYSLSGGHYETDGYLRNAFVDRNMVSARLGFSLPADMKLNAGLRYTENKSGMIVYNMPGAWSYDPNEPDSQGTQLGGPYVSFRQSQTGILDWGDGSYWKDKRMHIDLGISRKLKNFDFSVQTYLMDQDREEYFYAIDDPNHLVLRRDSEPEKNNWGWKADFESRIGAEKRHTAEYGVSGQYLGYGGQTVEEVDANYFLWMPTDSASKDKPTTILHGVYAQDLWEVNEKVQIQAGVRVDSYRADGPEANAVTVDETRPAPRIACIMNPWEGGRATMRVGQAYRFATNPEYYWWYSGYQAAGRKDLTSEKADQYEIELGQDVSEKLSVLVRGYYYEVQDYIRTIFGYRPSRVVYNIDQVDFMGVELEAGYNISSTFRASINFTHQETKKHGDVLDNSTTLDDGLPELPENKANLKLSYGRDKSLKAEIKVGYVDKRWSTQGDLTSAGGSYLAEMDSYFDVDMRVSYPIYHDNSDRQVRIEIAGDNILNEDIVEEYGYPMPGTTVMASLRANF